MKNIILFILVILSLFLSQCRNVSGRRISGIAPADTGHARIVFSDYEHDFGNVIQGEKVAYLFKFKNQGTADLVISSALTTCGCTVPEYDKKPIPPGGEGNMEVVFNTSGKEGKQTKTITVKSNAERPVVLLKITAEVIEGNK